MKRLFLVCVFLCGCQKSPYQAEEVLGADDFVMESYDLRGAAGGVQTSQDTIRVVGAVKKGGIITLEGATLSLKEALLRAGGIAFEGNKEQIHIERTRGTEHKNYLLSWEHIEKLPKESLLLKAGDVVTVEPLTYFRKQGGR